MHLSKNTVPALENTSVFYSAYIIATEILVTGLFYHLIFLKNEQDQKNLLQGPQGLTSLLAPVT